jgi:Zn-dependent protease with chaperone function
MSDIEQQAASYGTIEPTLKKGANESNEKLPLLLGRWEVAPERLYNIGVTCYVVWFIVHRVADMFYIASVDARFPDGLNHLYPSEAQRLESVSYTKQVLFCGMVHRILVFILVFSMIYLKLFARFDTALRSCFTWLSETRPCTWIGQLLYRMWYGRLATDICNRLPSCIGRCKDHCLYGRLATDVSNRFGFPYSIRELLLGALYLSLIGAIFFALSAPFMYWMQAIDLQYGFANSLSVSLVGFRRNFCAALVSMIIMGVPKKFCFLVVLQYRLGWVFMWAGILISTIYAQHNVSMIAPMLGLDTKFPTSEFVVGRGFPLVQTPNQWAPWISLNRLYWPDKFAESAGLKTNKFYTNDRSKGELALTHQDSGKWTVSGTYWFDHAAKVYAESVGGPSPKDLLSSLAGQSWTVNGQEAHMGVRSGQELRDKLFGFAKERQIGVGQVYMVDGSHKDARANAFVTGAGNHSIIGLYDTLFLGGRGSDASEEDEAEDAEDVNSPSVIEHTSEILQGVDREKELQDDKAPRSSAPSSAMNDDEIVAILAHELAHSALKHMEMGMGAQVVTSFVTFATLGWMAHSPLAAAALSLSAPLIHVGSCAYDHVVGPPLEGFMKVGTDALTRHNEFEADAYAALISEKYGTGLQTALAKLTVNSNQDPDPGTLFEALHADHPTFAKRWAHIEEVKRKAYGKAKTIEK